MAHWTLELLFPACSGGVQLLDLSRLTALGRKLIQQATRWESGSRCQLQERPADQCLWDLDYTRTRSVQLSAGAQGGPSDLSVAT